MTVGSIVILISEDVLETVRQMSTSGANAARLFCMDLVMVIWWKDDRFRSSRSICRLGLGIGIVCEHRMVFVANGSSIIMDSGT